MKAIDPGHSYTIDVYAAKEGDVPVTHGLEFVFFMHRIGDGYPGNKGAPYDGTNCQELYRVLIDREKYLDQQIPCDETKKAIELSRQALMQFEQRAAKRRGPDYFPAWLQSVTEFYANNVERAVEEIPACRTCGHIFCTKHNGDFS